MTSVSPALATVFVALIGDFERRPVVDQDRLKARVEGLVTSALEPVPPGQRIVLDAPQGIAVAFLGAAKLAFDMAERVAAGAGELPLHIGINYGPVTLFSDTNQGRGLAGDGLATAMILADAAVPGRMMASRAFRDALLADAPGSAARLSAAGTHTDRQVRTHELYTLNRRAARARRLRLAAVGAVAFASIVGVGAAARWAIEATRPPAVIDLQITPRGDVYVDGVLKGTSPPLTRLEVKPGPHMIEVRNGAHTPLTLEIHPGPAEEMTIEHAFVTQRPAAKPREKNLSDSVREGWRSLRESVGF